MNEPLLALERVSRRYGALRAVSEVDLTIQAGEVIALLGSNGAGKTSLLAMIAGLFEPESGAIAIRGEKSARRRRQLIGYCPQATLLWSDLTPREQLELIAELHGISKRDRQARVDELLAAIGLEEKADQLASTLSGGMQRRLNLALGLIHDPQLLVLDEPTANLDADSRRKVLAILAQSRRDRRTAILFSTHDAEDAERIADRVAVMDRGRLIALGTPAELKARAGVATTIEVTVGDARLTAVKTALEGAGVAPKEITTRSTTLEDAVRTIVGREPRVESSARPTRIPSTIQVGAPSGGRER